MGVTAKPRLYRPPNDPVQARSFLPRRVVDHIIRLSPTRSVRCRLDLPEWLTLLGCLVYTNDLMDLMSLAEDDPRLSSCRESLARQRSRGRRKSVVLTSAHSRSNSPSPHVITMSGVYCGSSRLDSGKGMFCGIYISSGVSWPLPACSRCA